MPPIRIATFNAENLFARYKFKSNIDPMKAVVNGWRADQRYFDIYDEPSKVITGRAIHAAGADVIALQEVENLDTLKRFRDNRKYKVGGWKAYPYAVAIDGNDPRLIDVAVLSRYPLRSIRTYQHLRENPRSFVFSRDCLEVEIEVPGGVALTLFVNHLKSMFDRKDPCHGRRKTRARREKQARAVKDIVTQRFGPRAGDHPFLVVGDLNDYLASDAQGDTGIRDLVTWDQVENVVDRIPEEDDRWTHYFKGNRTCGLPPAYKQLDYLLVSKSLAEARGGVPRIERRGMPLRAKAYPGPRFPEIEGQRKASDHCPVVMDLTV